MDPIDGISATRGAPGPALSGQEPARASRSAGATSGTAWPAAGTPAPAASDGGFSGPVRPTPVGVGGRFEKLLLAVQALRLDVASGTDQTRSTEEMRAAVEEIFSIDGVPQAFPSTGPDPAPLAQGQTAPAGEEAPAASEPNPPAQASDAAGADQPQP